MQAGNLAAARALFDRSLQVGEGLAKADPTSAQAQRDLSVSLDQLGDVEMQASNLAAARALFDRSLQVAEGLAKADPTSAQAQCDLSVSLIQLGGVEMQAGKLGNPGSGCTRRATAVHGAAHTPWGPTNAPATLGSQLQDGRGREI